MRKYLKERWAVPITEVGFAAFLNIYLTQLCATSLYRQDVLYLNVLLAVFGMVLLFLDYSQWKKKKQQEEEQKELLAYTNKEFLECKEKLENLSDYVTKWTHEIKLPLAALRLMNGRNQDFSLKKEMQDCIVRTENLLHTVLMGSKLQRPENDICMERISLEEAVKEAVKNQSYFLIQYGFEIILEIKDVWVYSDRRWLIYLLDQFIANAIKYRSVNPKLVFSCEKQGENQMCLKVEDNGIGISKEDLPYIFDKGYVGKNLRKGDYHSTGMGLYFAGKIGKMLNLSLKAVPTQERGSCFELGFCDMAEHFMM
ncbi:sensor histidine kinase [Blautia sp. Marseille-P3201T]|uniref:sensor histidine kinase n=1 Tax=Blautia sp. Marseille-P3201T TaxID=1907659 RepID=UPI000931C8D7|nr:HAMP domain-containing sensor histidine kinase [Blautia sp. Marseille-P3201T]